MKSLIAALAVVVAMMFVGTPAVQADCGGGFAVQQQVFVPQFQQQVVVPQSVGFFAAHQQQQFVTRQFVSHPVAVVRQQQVRVVQPVRVVKQRAAFVQPIVKQTTRTRRGIFGNTRSVTRTQTGGAAAVFVH